jgi:uncharacterized membrane protein
VGEAGLAEMTHFDQRPVPPTSFVSQRGMALVVYILYLIGYFTGFTALAGVIIAHVKASSADDVLRSHYRFQIRTFWVGLLYLAFGTLLAYVLIGVLILLWWFVWSIVRIVKGMVILNDGRAIARPTSWMFGG